MVKLTSACGGVGDISPRECQNDMKKAGLKLQDRRLFDMIKLVEKNRRTTRQDCSVYSSTSVIMIIQISD